ncbi:Imm63 family immunity protein, partial [Enterobacter asburiae]|uniref:Imm63 family immunity protein n=1 Tax=Enterobacter asburiae TaxID=61645 RepID=UPI003BBE4502
VSRRCNIFNAWPDSTYHLRQKWGYYQVTLSDDEILYWFVESAVAGLASTYAASHSSEREFREVYFTRQYSLMLSIKPEWATRKRKEIAELLHS